jgi:PHD/YefM family antitoxin component YafN of YafNO toxin-antitoxin module
METVSVTEFRSNIKRYLDIARDEELVIYRSKSESFVVTPLRKTDKKISLLNTAQKKAIDEALEDVANGRVHSHEQAMNILKTRHPKYFK